MKYNTIKKTTTTNLAGGEAYQESPKLELVSLLLTSFLKDQFYRSENQTLKRLKELIPVVERDFAAKAAIFARNEFGMRSISHVLTGELFRKNGEFSFLHGLPWAKNFVNEVIRRPDDATEILAYYKTNVMEKSLPKQLKVGLANALAKFDEYQLAKYKGEGKSFKLVDIANLTHPKGGEALSKLMRDDLNPADTWEVGMTRAGQKAETEEEKADLKKEVWKKLINNKKIGYFALLRNLRNIILQAPESIDGACEMLTNEEMIKKSLVLPFRFPTAMQQIQQIQDADTQGIRKVISALNKATDISLSNVPKMKGNTLVVLDGSGSMGWGEDPKNPFRIGSLFASVLVKANNADYVCFADSAEYQNLNIDNTILGIQTEIEQKRINGGTDFNSIFQILNKPYDRIVILSDMQGWVGYFSPKEAFSKYKKRTNCDPYIYSFDLAGHGTLEFPEQNICALAGFSDKIFDLMKIVEEDPQVLIHKIESITL